MKIAVRVDASLQIGTGHAVRCLALAGELRHKGAYVLFVCREHPGNVCDTITAEGFEIARLGFDQGDDNNDEKGGHEDAINPLAHAEWLGADQKVDVRQSINALQKDAPWDWLIVDHYAIDHRWETSMRKMANKVMVIDDIADRVHDCDILLDQNYFEDPESRYTNLVPSACCFLLGPRFALLRPEFLKARRFAQCRGNGINRALVYFGGNDPDNITGKTLSALCSPELENLKVEVVVGPQNPNKKSLQKIVKRRPRTRLHNQPPYFVELMLRADLAVGGGGTTTWERLCLNLPSIVITQADNQEPLTASLHNQGLVNWIGHSRSITEEEIKIAIFETISRYDECLSFSGCGLVDAMGALRVAETIMPTEKSALRLRQAVFSDMEIYYDWANDPETRQQSFQQKPITWPEHVEWFAGKLLCTDVIMMVMETPHGLPVGQVRFDIQNNVATINYSVDSLYRGRGWGKTLVFSGIQRFAACFPNIRIKALVKEENVPSCKLFETLNFSSTANNGIITYYSEKNDINQ